MGKIYKNFAVMRTDRIGEVLLSSVAVDRIKGAYPDARVTFVTSAYSRAIIEMRHNADEVITVDTGDKKKWFRKAVDLARELRKRRVDTAIVMNPHRILHCACFLAGIPRRIGYDRKWGFLLTSRLRDDRGKAEKHEVEYAMDLLNTVCAPAATPCPRLIVDSGDSRSVSGFLAGKGVKTDEPLVVVHPGSSNPAKIWPKERYIDLIRKLDGTGTYRVAVIGGNEERRLSAEIVSAAGGRVLDISGAFDLKKLAALLEMAKLFIGNDAGPMHMAAALGVPVVAIFGRNIAGVSPARWRPWGNKHVVFHENPGCDECHDTACPYDYRCLRMITAEAVFSAALRLLS